MSSFIPSHKGPFSLYLRDCRREVPEPQEAIIEGIVPKWIKGKLMIAICYCRHNFMPQETS